MNKILHSPLRSVLHNLYTSIMPGKVDFCRFTFNFVPFFRKKIAVTNADMICDHFRFLTMDMFIQPEEHSVLNISYKEEVAASRTLTP